MKRIRTIDANNLPYKVRIYRANYSIYIPKTVCDLFNITDKKQAVIQMVNSSGVKYLQLNIVNTGGIKIKIIKAGQAIISNSLVVKDLFDFFNVTQDKCNFLIKSEGNNSFKLKYISNGQQSTDKRERSI